MRSSHKLAVRRVANTAGYGSVNRAYLHGISTMDSALNCSVAAILRPLFPTRERKHYDRGKKRVTGAPARLSLRKCFYRPPQLSTSPPISIRRVSSRLLEAKKLPPRFQRTIPRFHTDLLDIYAISRISTIFGFQWTLLAPASSISWHSNFFDRFEAKGESLVRDPVFNPEKNHLGRQKPALAKGRGRL